MTTETLTLDAAWAAAEAELPDGWAMLSLKRDDDGQWCAFAAADGRPWQHRYRRASGPTPAAAVLALAGLFQADR